MLQLATRMDVATEPDGERAVPEPDGGELDNRGRKGKAPVAGMIRATADDDRARALLALVAAGNQSAYEELYRLLSRRVYAFVRRMLDNSESADEIMVDTMYEVWNTAARYRGASRVTTWVLAIARNKALMGRRSRPKARHENIDDFAQIIDSEVPDGFALLAQEQTREMVQRCIRKLSDKHRECIHLAYFEDMPIREIALLLGIPDGTVKSRLFEARAQLATAISALMPRAAGPVRGSIVELREAA